MIRSFAFLSGLILAASVTVVTAQDTTSGETSGEPLDEIVAVVNDNVILRSEMELSLASVQQQIRARGGQMPPMDVLRSQVLERLIMTELEVQRAEQTGIRASDADIDAAIRDVAAQNRISVDQLRQALEQDGFDFGEFREEMRDEILSQRLRARVVNSMTNVTESEVDVYLATEELGGGQYNLSQILIALPDGASPEQIEVAEQEAQEVYQRLNEGLEFAAAAVSYSDAQDALEGGLVGWRDANSVPTIFADALDRLDVGDHSQPIRSPAGFHLIRINDKRDQAQVMVTERRARHILIEPNELFSEERARERINLLHERIENGEDFGELAEEYSDDTSTANVGGSMGWVPENAFSGTFEEVLASLEPGQVSQPFQAGSGWHLLMLEDVRTTDRTDEAIRATAREQLRQAKGDIELNQFLRRLRDESYIDIRLDS